MTGSDMERIAALRRRLEESERKAGDGYGIVSVRGQVRGGRTYEKELNTFPLERIMNMTLRQSDGSEIPLSSSREAVGLLKAFLFGMGVRIEPYVFSQTGRGAFRRADFEANRTVIAGGAALDQKDSHYRMKGYYGIDDPSSPPAERLEETLSYWKDILSALGGKPVILELSDIYSIERTDGEKPMGDDFFYDERSGSVLTPLHEVNRVHNMVNPETVSRLHDMLSGDADLDLDGTDHTWRAENSYREELGGKDAQDHNLPFALHFNGGLKTYELLLSMAKLEYIMDYRASGEHGGANIEREEAEIDRCLERINSIIMSDGRYSREYRRGLLENASSPAGTRDAMFEGVAASVRSRAVSDALEMSCSMMIQEVRSAMEAAGRNLADADVRRLEAFWQNPEGVDAGWLGDDMSDLVRKMRRECLSSIESYSNAASYLERIHDQWMENAVPDPAKGPVTRDNWNTFRQIAKKAGIDLNWLGGNYCRAFLSKAGAYMEKLAASGISGLEDSIERQKGLQKRLDKIRSGQMVTASRIRDMRAVHGGQDAWDVKALSDIEEWTASVREKERLVEDARKASEDGSQEKRRLLEKAEAVLEDLRKREDAMNAMRSEIAEYRALKEQFRHSYRLMELVEGQLEAVGKECGGGTLEEKAVRLEEMKRNIETERRAAEKEVAEEYLRRIGRPSGTVRSFWFEKAEREWLENGGRLQDNHVFDSRGEDARLMMSRLARCRRLSGHLETLHSDGLDDSDSQVVAVRKELEEAMKGVSFPSAARDLRFEADDYVMEDIGAVEKDGRRVFYMPGNTLINTPSLMMEDMYLSAAECGVPSEYPAGFFPNGLELGPDGSWKVTSIVPVYSLAHLKFLHSCVPESMRTAMAAASRSIGRTWPEVRKWAGENGVQMYQAGRDDEKWKRMKNVMDSLASQFEDASDRDDARRARGGWDELRRIGLYMDPLNYGLDDNRHLETSFGFVEVERYIRRRVEGRDGRSWTATETVYSNAAQRHDERFSPMFRQRCMEALRGEAMSWDRPVDDPLEKKDAFRSEEMAKEIGSRERQRVV